MSKIKKNILAAMLLAIFIILNRFVSIKTEILVISFTFVPMMMSAIWLGPVYSTVIALLGDFIGAILFPFGPYFPGFTVSSAISGLIYGLFLYNKGNEMSNKRLLIMLIISSLIQLIAVNIFITSLWIHMLYGKAYLAIMAGRTVTQLVMIPIHVISIYILEKFSRPYMKKYLYEEK